MDEQHLSSTDERFQQWVYALSHDMGAPLRAVVQFSLLLSRKMDERLDEKERYWLHLIHENGALGQSMIEGLLAYSRLSTHSWNFNEEVSLRASLESGVRALEMSQDIKPINIDTTELSHTIEGNFDLWQQYFAHLLDNSLKYQFPESTPMIRVSSKQENGYLSILVEDNGVGVKTEKFEDITLPFKRLVSPKDYPGVGMGLSYCQRIAELHKGRLSFSASPLGGLSVITQFAI